MKFCVTKWSDKKAFAARFVFTLKIWRHVLLPESKNHECQNLNCRHRHTLPDTTIT
jgi:hypothetical protein